MSTAAIQHVTRSQKAQGTCERCGADGDESEVTDYADAIIEEARAVIDGLEA
jgi:peptide subunit release factor 1 (eRF1)